ncbi:hypothetical protein pBCA040 (plasmid) [Burkholderia cenocepacia J2315]|uniref:Uncharacterized protein n=1 Tax=Burkholderia cenocepacia (strain ATCC BAA-245 / DSM 16553 / LMG 16656 / NCTC 13227 / J2315 / CF5610) TaxID=216591 RepID=B4EQH8_BURCJ|nr:hypothetical protein pBCA040 [Burkholderia cenocepacia J2315]
MVELELRAQRVRIVDNCLGVQYRCLVDEHALAAAAEHIDGLGEFACEPGGVVDGRLRVAGAWCGLCAMARAECSKLSRLRRLNEFLEVNGSNGRRTVRRDGVKHRPDDGERHQGRRQYRHCMAHPVASCAARSG